MWDWDGVWNDAVAFLPGAKEASRAGYEVEGAGSKDGSDGAQTLWSSGLRHLEI